MHVHDLSGKVALVTGASRGIGRACALALAQRGAAVAVHYHASEVQAQEVVDEITSQGGAAFALRADLSTSDGAEKLIFAFSTALQTQTGSSTAGAPSQSLPAVGFDILVNNAGVGLRKRIEAVTPDDFDRLIQVHLKSPFFLIQHALPLLRDNGRIINISSMGTRAAYPEMSVYAPAKAGLEALTLLLAEQLGERGITVNAVRPGATVTDLNPRASDPEMAKIIARTVALRRVGQPGDIADIVAFLASHEGRWVTGQSIDASGGQRL